MVSCQLPLKIALFLGGLILSQIFFGRYWVEARFKILNGKIPISKLQGVT